MKRLLYIIGVIAGIALIIGGGYYLRYQTTSEIPGGDISGEGGLSQNLPVNNNRPAATTTPVTAGIPQIQSFGAVSPDPVAAYFIDPKDNILILKADGQIVRMTSAQTEILSPSKIEGVFHASFSSSGRRLLVATEEDGGLRHNLFEVEKGSWQALPAGIRAAAWSPSDDRLAYISSDDELVLLNLSDPQARPQNLTRVPWVGMGMSWPSADTIVFHTKPSARTGSYALAYSIRNRTLTPLFEDIRGGSAAWSPDGARGILFESNANERGGRLALLDGGGAVVRQFSLFTLPSKCTFHTELAPRATSTATSTTTRTAATSSPPDDREYLICGVPRYTETISRAELPDEYYQMGLFTEDDVLAIELRSGNLLPVFDDPAHSVDADRPRMANGKLYFINRLDGRLYAAKTAGL